MFQKHLDLSTQTQLQDESACGHASLLPQTILLYSITLKQPLSPTIRISKQSNPFCIPSEAQGRYTCQSNWIHSISSSASINRVSSFHSLAATRRSRTRRQCRGRGEEHGPRAAAVHVRSNGANDGRADIAGVYGENDVKGDRASGIADTQRRRIRAYGEAVANHEGIGLGGSHCDRRS